MLLLCPLEKNRKKANRKFREAGADRYLLRHETADEAHYRYLHPENLSLSNRIQCLYDLKELGYQIGAGFMVGAPGQTMENLAEDLVFLKKLNPHMAGIGPFIPHHDTKFAKEEPGSVELTLFLLSVIRIMLPVALQQAINMGVNMMDTMMLGSFGEIQLSHPALQISIIIFLRFCAWGSSGAPASWRPSTGEQEKKRR